MDQDLGHQNTQLDVIARQPTRIRLRPMRPPSLSETLARLVAINSVNPAYSSGPGEGQIGLWIRAFFEQRGIEVWEQEVFPGRPNIIAKLRGKDSRRRVILEAHMDTVSIQGMTIPPFDPSISEEKLFGRGSCDTKAGLAAMMEAVASIHRDGILPPCEIWLAAVVDEEFSYRGVVKLCEELAAEAALVAEPTQMRAVIASKGVLRWRIGVRGKAAHSGKPHLGVNAINHMARIVLALEQEHHRLASAPHPLLGPATLNTGVIHGGVQVNFVPDTCTIEVDRRLLPGETPASVLSHTERILEALQIAHPDMDAFMEPPMLVDEALETPENSAPARLAAELLREAGLESSLCGVPFGSDASKLSRRGIPSIIIGPGSIDRAHAAVEYVELSQVQQAFDFYRNFLLRFE